MVMLRTEVVVAGTEVQVGTEAGMAETVVMGGEQGGSVNPDTVLQRHIDDWAEWTRELSCAHTGLAWGRDWGLPWATCVSAFFNFESAHGYSEENAQVQTTLCPREVSDCLLWGRQRDRGLGSWAQRGSKEHGWTGGGHGGHLCSHLSTYTLRGS
jgi:hypothetical protein